MLRTELEAQKIVYSQSVKNSKTDVYHLVTTSSILENNVHILAFVVSCNHPNL